MSLEDYRLQEFNRGLDDAAEGCECDCLTGTQDYYEGHRMGEPEEEEK